MKVKGYALSLAIVITLTLSLSNALAASPIYLGKFNITATVNQSTTGTPPGTQFTMSGALTHLGDEFYQFTGYVSVAGDGPFIVSGSGFLNVDKLMFTLSESQKHVLPWRDSGTMNITINTTTMSGSFYDVGFDYDIQRRTWNRRFTAGTLSVTNLPPLQ